MAGRLLIVGEVDDNLRQLTMELQVLGLSVEAASDGLAAIELGAKFQPDLVVTEILTSRLSGFELALRVRNGTAGFSAPVIFYTEFYRDEKARRDVLAKYRATHYFVRPFQKEALKKAIAANFEEFLRSVAAQAGSAVTEESAASESDALPPLMLAAAAAERAPQTAAPAITARPGSVAPGVPSAQDFPLRFLDIEAQPATSEELPADKTVVETSEPDSKSREEASLQRPRLLPDEATAPTESGSEQNVSSRPILATPAGSGLLRHATAFRAAVFIVAVVVGLYFLWAHFRLSGNDPQSVAKTSEAPKPASSVVPTPQSDPVVPADSAVPQPVTSSLSQESKETTTETPKGAVSDVSAGLHPPTAQALKPLEPQLPSVGIRDVTGARKGPILRKMKAPEFTAEELELLQSKALVVRIVIDGAGKVTEVTPLNQQDNSPGLSPHTLAAIQRWEFSSRKKAGGEAVKYYSFKAQGGRRQ